MWQIGDVVLGRYQIDDFLPEGGQAIRSFRSVSIDSSRDVGVALAQPLCPGGDVSSVLKGNTRHRVTKPV